MANDIVGNPMWIDTAATIWTNTNRKIRMIQWVDDNNDIADGDDLVITINGVTLTFKIQITDNTANNLSFWTLGPFNPGMVTHQFGVTTIDHGALLVIVE